MSKERVSNNSVKIYAKLLKEYNQLQAQLEENKQSQLLLYMQLKTYKSLHDLLQIELEVAYNELVYYIQSKAQTTNPYNHNILGGVSHIITQHSDITIMADNTHHQLNLSGNLQTNFLDNANL